MQTQHDLDLAKQSLKMFQVKEAWGKINQANVEIKELTMQVASLSMNTCTVKEPEKMSEFKEMYRALFEKYINVKGARVSEWTTSRNTIHDLEEIVSKLTSVENDSFYSISSCNKIKCYVLGEKPPEGIRSV